MSSLFVPVWAHRAEWKKLLKLVCCCCCPVEHGSWNVGMGGVTQKIWYRHTKAPLKIVVRAGDGRDIQLKLNAADHFVLSGEGEVGLAIYRPATLTKLSMYFGQFPVLHFFKFLVQIISWHKENNPPKWLNFFPDENKIPTFWNFDQSSPQILMWQTVY